MSYILDALKKSEQERGHGHVPGVQTVHSSSLSYRSEKKTYWPYILIAAVLLNLLAILYFIVDKEKPATNITERNSQQTPVANETHLSVAEKISQQDATPPPAIDQPENFSAPAIVKPGVFDQATADSAASKKTPTAQASSPVQKKAAPDSAQTGSKAAKNKAEMIEFYDLPDGIKEQLPAIIISAHVYSTNPLQRSIVINDNFMEEGEYVIDDLVLIEITPDGAIFDYQGTRFHLGVVSSWQ